MVKFCQRKHLKNSNPIFVKYHVVRFPKNEIHESFMTFITFLTIMFYMNSHMSSRLWSWKVYDEVLRLIGCDICFTEIPASDWSVMRWRLDSGGVHLWQTAGVLHRTGGAPAIRGNSVRKLFWFRFMCVGVFCCCICVTIFTFIK